MDNVITAIKEALTKYSYQDLCEGSEVRDTLLDLLLLAQGKTISSSQRSDGLIVPLEVEKI